MNQPIQCTEEDLQELKRLALAVRAVSDDDDALGIALDEYDEHANPDQVLCLFEAIGRVTAERDALQLLLNAKDERVDALGSLVPEAELALKALNVAVSVFDVELADSARRGLRLIIAGLKPAESLQCQFPQSCPSNCGCDIPDFTPGNGNRARRRAESLGLTIPAAPTAYDGFDNGVD